jgi:glycosyltransferase involved in cell wall biosynthesis
MSLVVGIILINRQEVVIATSPPLTIGLISWLLAYCWKAPAVYKVAEVYPDLAIRQGAVRHPSLIKFFRWIEELVYAGNTKIVTIAEQFKRLLHERGVPDNKLIMIRDSVDIDLYHPSNRDNAFSREHRLVNSFVVLYAGNIGLFQDWESVLCSAELVSRYPITIVIIGDGIRREWLIDQVRHRGLDNVKWIGYQAAERMSEINASCDIAIIPMTRAGALDGLPSKIYTIMACGKPVIATADVASDMAWLIQEAKCGRVVPPDDPRALAEAIEAAYLDPASLSSEGENGRQFVKEFSKESIAQKYSNLILSLVGGR